MVIYSLGSRGDGVRELQILLAATGLPGAGWLDGVYGWRTETAVRLAQERLGLPVTGAVDEDLLARLRGRSRLHVALQRARTPATVEQLQAALRAGYEAVFLRAGNELATRVALAQLQEEHGVELEAIWNYNLGNQAVVAWGGPYVYLTAREVIGGVDVQRSQALRAFATHTEGATGYWARLVEGYAGALEYFETGEPGAAAEVLKELKYFTGDLERYRQAMIERFAALA